MIFTYHILYERSYVVKHAVYIMQMMCPLSLPNLSGNQNLYYKLMEKVKVVKKECNF